MYSPEQRATAIQRIVEGLTKGTPLTVLCQPDDMPGLSTIYEWMDADEAISGKIARAREAGFDQIALDALAIADEVTDKDTEVTEYGERPNKEWLMRSKLRVETRLKLLSKWDPKRYGDRLAIAGEEGSPIRLAVSSEDAGL